jgi:methylmalonyl-CoA mutase N-terminal domain/subunit
MPQSSLQKAVDVLLEKDFITEENGVYKVLDPIWGSYFKTF